MEKILMDKHGLLCIVLGGISSAFISDFIFKVIVPILVMLIGTYLSFHYRKHLEKKSKNKKK